MNDLFSYCPGPPDYRLRWEDLRAAYDWLRALDGCPQDPAHHAEGDVGTHTRMVCEELLALPAWRALGEQDRQALFAAAVLHDLAKPECTRIEDDGRVTSRGHSARGAIRARGLLWRQRAPFGLREQVCALVRHHQQPYFLIDRADGPRRCIEISQTARCDRLALLAEADVRGRACADKQRLLDNVALFAEQAAELGCLSAAYPFSSDHARVLYFRDERRVPEAPAYETFRARVVVMSGLPGAGKDHHVRAQLAGWAVVAPDELRDGLGVAPDEDQGRVIQAARERAREHLRRRQPFVWNATNISRQLRRQVLGLLLDYHAHVQVRYVEAAPEVLSAQNRGRARRVPEEVIRRLIDRWEVPDVTEAHEVLYNVGMG